MVLPFAKTRGIIVKVVLVKSSAPTLLTVLSVGVAPLNTTLADVGAFVTPPAGLFGSAVTVYVNVLL